MHPMRQARWFPPALLVLCSALTGEGTAAAPPPGGRTGTDLHGDPLPTGALVRLGTIRFRQPGEWNAPLHGFTPDGKTLVSGGKDVRVWEADTGRLVRVIPCDFSAHGFALSRDGKLAAAAGF